MVAKPDKFSGRYQRLGAQNQDPNFGREIGLFMDEQSIRDLVFEFPQGVYASLTNLSPILNTLLSVSVHS